MPLNDGPVTLLVVDDEKAICNALRKFLVQQGFEVATASSGEEALLTFDLGHLTASLGDGVLVNVMAVFVGAWPFRYGLADGLWDAWRGKKGAQRSARVGFRTGSALPHG